MICPVAVATGSSASWQTGVWTTLGKQGGHFKCSNEAGGHHPRAPSAEDRSALGLDPIRLLGHCQRTGMSEKKGTQDQPPRPWPLHQSTAPSFLVLHERRRDNGSMRD